MEVLKKPLITEKMSKLGERGIYGFIVERHANKVMLKKAVEDMYGVTVMRINTLRYAGKKKTRYTKKGVNQGKTAAFKKALVYLKEGDMIDFYDNV